MKPTVIKCTDEQFDTILAALRCYQRALDEGSAGEFHEIATDSGLHKRLSADDIEEFVCDDSELWHTIERATIPA